MSEPLSDRLPEESAEDLYENAPCGYVSTLHDGLIVRSNQTFLSWAGYAAREIVGQKRLADLLTVGGRIYYETHCAPLLQIQGSLREIALELRCANGHKLPILINAVLKRAVGNTPDIIRITIFDALDRRAYEKELLRARISAEEAVQAKAAFIAMVSHEIRSPLGAVMAARHLLEKTELSAPQRKIVDMLRSSTSSLMALVNDILDISKLDAGRALLAEVEFNPRSLVAEMLSSLHARAEEKGLALTAHVDEQIPEKVVGDPIKIRQILVNLVTNGIKFTDAGGVRIALRAVSEGDAALITFKVTDTGIGIAPDQLATIFDAYTQASAERHSHYGGTGLGLAICKKLVALHGASLTVSSEVGAGSTFGFTLRLQRAAEQRGSPESTSEQF